MICGLVQVLLNKDTKDLGKCNPKFCHKCYKLVLREHQLLQHQSCIPNTVTAPIQNETSMQGAVSGTTQPLPPVTSPPAPPDKSLVVETDDDLAFENH